MRIALDAAALQDLERSSRLEWLETNGRGGFAASTVSGANTRRYHGLLVAALQPPVRRHVLLSRIEDTLEDGDRRAELGANFYASGVVDPPGWKRQTGFRLDPFPVTTFEALDRKVERAIFMVHGEDTVVLRWTLLRGKTCTLHLRPFHAFRDYHALRGESADFDPTVRVSGVGRASVQPYAGMPELFFHYGSNVTAASPGDLRVRSAWWRQHRYPREEERGLDHLEDLHSPFELRLELNARAPVVLVVSTAAALKIEPALLESHERARRAAVVAQARKAAPGLDETLALAADAFLVKRAGGASTVIAGYPWFTDWGRDSMISLPGLCLATGRHDEARDVLLAFARHANAGMIPNRFPDSGDAPEYNNVDGTLWFAHAVGRYAAKTRDLVNVERHFMPVLLDIVRRHREGTRYGIRMTDDGLITAGEPGQQLTWMDAKVDGWVVTPRIGKPVEVNALWIEALETTASLAAALGRPAEARELADLVRLARTSFVRRFWNEETACLFDVIDGPEGNDPSLRPNQVIAAALPHAALDGPRALAVVDVVRRELLTPYGLRTLSPRDSRYRAEYSGGRVERDGAYHQGTVWPWLMGPFVRAFLRTHPGAEAREEARGMLRPLLAHLGGDAGLGQISEVFDAEPPHAAKGCFSQAWSVAELLALQVELASGE